VTSHLKEEDAFWCNLMKNSRAY